MSTAILPISAIGKGGRRDSISSVTFLRRSCSWGSLGYTEEFSEPYIFEYERLRYALLTCYDFYFYEAFAAIARKNVDIIIGCFLQRSDSHDALEILCRFLAYNTNAYVIRSSVSFAGDSPICGASMVVSPRGEVLCNMKSRFIREMVEKVHAHGIICNVFYSDDEQSRREYLDMGNDTILTNDYQAISQIVEEYK